jgi:phosphohistidine phosphatase
MNLYIARHADALLTGGTVVRDADRPLSKQGERDAAAVGRALASLEPSMPLIVTSPLVRAQRTGEVLRSAFLRPPALEAWEELAPGFRRRTLLARVIALTGAAVIMVGHQPDLTNFIAYLVADGAAEIALAPGAVALLKLQPGGSAGSARLHWLLTPEIINTLHPPA